MIFGLIVFPRNYLSSPIDYPWNEEQCNSHAINFPLCYCCTIINSLMNNFIQSTHPHPTLSVFLHIRWHTLLSLYMALISCGAFHFPSDGRPTQHNVARMANSPCPRATISTVPWKVIKSALLNYDFDAPPPPKSTSRNITSSSSSSVDGRRKWTTAQ